MGASLRVLAIDMVQFRSMLGSGEERFCAKVLKSVPPAVDRLGLLKEWRRDVTGLVLGDPGERMAAFEPFLMGPYQQAGPSLSLAFASLLIGFSEPGLGGWGSGLGDLAQVLVRRPLFALDADGELVRWGGLRRDLLRLIGPHPLIVPIQVKDLDVVTLSGSAWADGERGDSEGFRPGI
jgi:hypothetical protein